MASDVLIPACGGTEPVSVINGRRWQYCYHPASGRHCYLDVDNDRITWHRGFHPAWAPHLELEEEPELNLTAAKRPLQNEELSTSDFYF